MDSRRLDASSNWDIVAAHLRERLLPIETRLSQRRYRQLRGDRVPADSTVFAQAVGLIGELEDELR